MRGTIFIKREDADAILYKRDCKLSTPSKVFSIVTPCDLRNKYESTERDMVELEVPDGVEFVNTVMIDSVYAMHKCESVGIYRPWLNLSQPNLIGRRTVISNRVYGWTHPMPDWTLKENKKHMEEWAYHRMIEKLAMSYDSNICARVEEIMWDIKITKDLIERFFL